MSGKTVKTFEDRLLDELRREIALRGEDGPEPVVRRRITPRRAVVALVACVAAAGAVVALPSSQGGSSAYAVERHEDGSVTVSMRDIVLSGDDKRELRERLRADGISVTVDRPRSGYACAQPRGEAYQPAWAVGSGDAPVMPVHAFTLRPGDSLVFEEPQWGTRGRAPASVVYAFKGRVEPCQEVPWDGSGARRDSFEEQ
ncbi:hypothetical protein RM704_25130 [Streptomyces sp. DSM 3412]|uniref:Uncharacterized protein n=1 Tax=Streptomyces gottesmaniae TaxID=3075518 RepID=A0ABU2Z285_9ACTN|nr:hypothetical protein [Streptomyces sp. DSM 3412]MDT0570702.1 hypothetical protein [Streptomyces sp. DSM 3412]